MTIFLTVVVTILVLIPVFAVLWVFVWAARRDGEDDEAMQRRLGIRRGTRMGR